MDGLGWYGCTPCPSAGRGVKWLPRVRGCQTTHQRSCSMETTSIDPSVNGGGEFISEKFRGLTQEGGVVRYDLHHRRLPSGFQKV